MAVNGELLTPLIVTHYSSRSTYGELAPPSDGIVRRTIGSMEENVCEISSDIISTPMLIYNHPKHLSGDRPIEYKTTFVIFQKNSG